MVGFAMNVCTRTCFAISPMPDMLSPFGFTITITCVRTLHSDTSHPLPTPRRCNPNGMTRLNALTAPQITQLINPRKCAKCNRRL